MLNIIKNEPARVVAAVLALIGVASSFGLGITDGQQAAIVALVSAGLAILGGETVRAQVLPTNKLTSTATQPANLTDPVAAPAPAADAPGEAGQADIVLLLLVVDTIVLALLFCGVHLR